MKRNMMLIPLVREPLLSGRSRGAKNIFEGDIGFDSAYQTLAVFPFVPRINPPLHSLHTSEFLIAS